MLAKVYLTSLVILNFSFCSDLDINIEDNGDGTFSIYYNVKDAGEYTLSVKFGGQTIPEGFYTFTVSFFFVLNKYFEFLFTKCKDTDWLEIK